MTPALRTLLSVALVVVALWFYEKMRPEPQPPGVLVADAPVVRIIEGAPQIFKEGDHTLTVLGTLNARARVVSLTRYRQDRAARLSPYDLAAAWGPLSDSVVLKAIDIAQTERGVVFKSFDPKLPDEVVEDYLVNLHVVAATPEVREKLERLRTGNLVRMQGSLVEAVGSDGWRWKGEARMRSPLMPGTLLWLDKLDIE